MHGRMQSVYTMYYAIIGTVVLFMTFPFGHKNTYLILLL